MIKRITRNTVIGIAVAGALTIGGSIPAWADHTGGAELTDLGSAGENSCYVGGLLSGIPATLFTPNYAIRDSAGKRHLVCYFETAPSYSADPEGGGYDWSWTAPTRPTTWYGSAPTCVEPGGSADGYTDAAQSTPRFVQYRTHLVMYCSWSSTDLLFP
ncbi:hypothetical protein SAMN04487846_2174 [Microbacterium sp. cf046]|uniref:hypothetical protein n=1 Tax=Microbacterium sp. cf046 TaxID=1761803 RepID=UPI0008E63000|nr:hypothetical protein [Microbacterium sp. cf046]SFS06963.1 hypothetical protein SAMN04487846_2174 [Microbacterium sp. cf046]